MIDYSEELENYVQFIRESMPEEIRRIINTAKYDLYFGPYSEDDDTDGDGFKYPGFCKAADMIEEWADDITDVPLYDLIFEDENGDELSEPIEERVGEIDSCDILRAILGKELFSTIYR